MQKFPSLQWAYDVARQGGLAPAVLNAADEVAVAAFLQGRIRFTAIYTVVDKTLEAHLRCAQGHHVSLAAIKQTDLWAREYAKKEIERLR